MRREWTNTLSIKGHLCYKVRFSDCALQVAPERLGNWFSSQRTPYILNKYSYLCRCNLRQAKIPLKWEISPQFSTAWIFYSFLPVTDHIPSPWKYGCINVFIWFASFLLKKCFSLRSKFLLVKIFKQICYCITWQHEDDNYFSIRNDQWNFSVSWKFSKVRMKFPINKRMTSRQKGEV